MYGLKRGHVGLAKFGLGANGEQAQPSKPDLV